MHKRHEMNEIAVKYFSIRAEMERLEENQSFMKLNAWESRFNTLQFGK